MDEKAVFTYGDEEIELVDYFVALMSKFFMESGKATYFTLRGNPGVNESGDKYMLVVVGYDGSDDFLTDLAMGFVAGWRAKSGESVDDLLAQ